jgi:GrpB-like predicted nucleotidyltransferase (UPF0157 family)
VASRSATSLSRITTRRGRRSTRRTWSASFNALGEHAAAVEHIGSTSVPGLGAKPIIDVLVTVADITAEEDYLNPLLAAGYELRVREPGHRMVRNPERDAHVHVLEVNDPAAFDHLLLRDRLRTDARTGLTTNAPSGTSCNATGPT